MDEELKKLLKRLEDFEAKYASDVVAALERQSGEILAAGGTATATKEALAVLEKTVEEITVEKTALFERLEAIEKEKARPKTGSFEEIVSAKSFGEMFGGSDQYESMIKSGRWQSDVMEIPTKTFWHGPSYAKTTLASTDIDIMPLRLPGILAPLTEEMTIRSLVPSQSIDTNAVEYVQESSFTNAAAPVAEGAAKPEGAIDFELKTSPIRTLAYWIPATRQVLADVRQLRQYIDQRLLFGLQYVEEQQFLYGDGTGQNLLGFMENTAAQSIGQQSATMTMIDVIRHAITKIQVEFMRPSGVVLNPNDWARIELKKDTTGQYIWANPASLLGPRIWSLPVVTTTAMEEGSFLVGAFRQAATIWDREGANIAVSDQHADFFTKNLIAIRCEERVGLTTFRPRGLVKGTFTAS